MLLSGRTTRCGSSDGGTLCRHFATSRHASSGKATWIHAISSLLLLGTLLLPCSGDVRDDSLSRDTSVQPSSGRPANAGSGWEVFAEDLAVRAECEGAFVRALHRGDEGSELNEKLGGSRAHKTGIDVILPSMAAGCELRARARLVRACSAPSEESGATQSERCGAGSEGHCAAPAEPGRIELHAGGKV